MKRIRFVMDYATVLQKLHDAPDLLNAQQLKDIGIIGDKSRCYELVRRGLLPVYMRERGHMWFHRDNMIDYVMEILKSNDRRLGKKNVPFNY